MGGGATERGDRSFSDATSEPRCHVSSALATTPVSRAALALARVPCMRHVASTSRKRIAHACASHQHWPPPVPSAGPGRVIPIPVSLAAIRAHRQPWRWRVHGACDIDLPRAHRSNACARASTAVAAGCRRPAGSCESDSVMINWATGDRFLTVRMRPPPHSDDQNATPSAFPVDRLKTTRHYIAPGIFLLFWIVFEVIDLSRPRKKVERDRRTSRPKTKRWRA